SLTLTPMLNAYLTKPGKQSRSKFYQVTEKYFVAMNESYKSALEKLMQRKWLSFPILIGCMGLIVLFYSLLKKETAPYDDRSFVSMSVTAPEGSSYEYMDKLMTDITKLINDSIPEKKVSLILTSPGFGTSSVNSGRANVALVDPSERERSQREIADDLGKWAKAFVGGRSNVSERPTISVNRRGGPPIQFIIQAKNFQKLEEKVPEFMAEAEKDPTFSFVD